MSEKFNTLKLKRIENSIRALDVSRATGIHPSTLSLIENGWKKASPETEKQIAEAIEQLSSLRRGGSQNE